MQTGDSDNNPCRRHGSDYSQIHVCSPRLPLLMFSNIRCSIHHPFLLSDNRHYTFYIWRRVFRLHPIVPSLFAPGYLACAWAWFLRIGMLISISYTNRSAHIVYREGSNIATDSSPPLRSSSYALTDSASRAAVFFDTIYSAACSDRRNAYLGRHHRGRLVRYY